jgi:hypothetical protein
VPLARPPLTALATFVALAVLIAGCGSDGSGSGYGSRDSTGDPPTATATTPEAPPGASVRTCEGTVAGTGELRVTGIGCEAGRGVVAAWAGKPSCAAPAGASRFSCALADGYRCTAAAAGQGIAVSCAHPGASVAFVVRRG